MWTCGAAVLLVVVCCLALGQATADAPPNIIFLMADQGWGDIGYNNITYHPGAGAVDWPDNRPRTPNLDALAASDNTLLFHRFYAGSGVCSPTRSSVLTGRTSDRECIFSAEGCGTEPAWTCVDPYPLPPTTFTAAELAKANGYATIHIGKWHLGDFFPKGDKHPSYAHQKWPVSHPGVHGFDEWASTEASAPSSTTNCGCEAEWKSMAEGGCITGGGVFQDSSFDCTNYWFPADLGPDHKPTRAACHNATTSDLSCAHNLTEKIKADDSEYIMDVFEDFLQRKTQGSEKAPFFAVIWLHTVHEPHPALPQYYNAYNDSLGNPAGDYLGTLTQMDVQVGRLMDLLKSHGVADNTMLAYTSDNGPHLGDKGSDRTQWMATNGLRQCKASLFEGGIRVPGFIHWPNVIKQHKETMVPAYVSDYLPTMLDILGAKHPNPTWAADGESLLPRMTGDPSVNRTKPLVFQLGKQAAIIDGDWKILANPAKGQCPVMAAPYSEKEAGKSTYLFNLADDPKERFDLSKSQATRFAAMKKMLDDFAASVENSQVNESGCEPKSRV